MARIKQFKKDYGHVLCGGCSSLETNGPRALMQAEAEAILVTLHWVIGKSYKSKLRGADRD